MADPDEILSAIKSLAAAYPDKPLSKETIQVYVGSLQEIPVEALQRAVQECIRTSPWFPRVSDLHRLSLQVAGKHRFDESPEHSYRSLYAEQVELYASMARGEPLDEGAWRALIDKFRRYGYEDAANHNQRRLAHIQSSLSHVPEEG